MAHRTTARRSTRHAARTLPLLVWTWLLVLLVGGEAARAAIFLRDYSPADALRSLHYANATYAKPSQVLRWDCGHSCRAHPHFQVLTLVERAKLGVAALVGVDDEVQKVVVALRGPARLRKWYEKLVVNWAPYEKASGCGHECQVHAGFQTAYVAMRHDLRTTVIRALADHATHDVLVTGHAYGGALAQLAAADLQLQLNRMLFVTKPTVSLYTFGAPRVATSRFRHWTNAQLARSANYRVTNAGDAVPQLPMSPEGYWKVAPSPGAEVRCEGPEDTQCHMCDWDPYCASPAEPTRAGEHRCYFGECIVV